MTSVRPKLAAQTPKIVTGWDTRTGRSLYRSRTGDWGSEPEAAEILTHERADIALALAREDQGRVTDPYLMEVSESGEIAGRESLRERLRATGPSVHLHLGRQAGNG